MDLFLRGSAVDMVNTVAYSSKDHSDHARFKRRLRKTCITLAAVLLVGLLPESMALANGDAAAGKAAWIKTCEHCHGSPQKDSKAAFSDYDTTANKLSVYASDAGAITKAANEGYTIPEGNTNDKDEPGKSSKLAMGTWSGMAPNRLGLGTTPTQYAIDFAAYFATFFSAPDTPSISSVTAGNGQATVNFSAPKSELTITSYTVTANPGGFTATGTASPIVVSGLANDSPYTFTVTATSNAGNSKPSSASNSVVPVASAATATPAKVPVAAPAAVVATANPVAVSPVAVSKTQAPVNPAAPSTPVLKQGVVSAPVTSTNNVAGVAGNVPVVKPSAQIISAAPVNVVVANPVAAKSIPAPVVTPPEKAPAPAKPVTANQAATPLAGTTPPIILTVRAGSAQAKVFFLVAANGPTATNYSVEVLTGGKPSGITASGPKSPILVSGLTNGTDYTFVVTANYATGKGYPSEPSSIVTPLRILGD